MSDVDPELRAHVTHWLRCTAWAEVRAHNLEALRGSVYDAFSRYHGVRVDPAEFHATLRALGQTPHEADDGALAWRRRPMRRLAANVHYDCAQLLAKLKQRRVSL